MTNSYNHNSRCLSGKYSVKEVIGNTCGIELPSTKIISQNTINLVLHYSLIFTLWSVIIIITLHNVKMNLIFSFPKKELFGDMLISCATHEKLKLCHKRILSDNLFETTLSLHFYPEIFIYNVS